MEDNHNHDHSETALVTDKKIVHETPGLETVNNVVSKEVRPLTPPQFKFETWWILVFLVFALLLLKGFIYIKDQKRDGK